MARFARIDSQICANSPILASHFIVPELNPFFCESRFGGLKIANRSFEAIRANRSHVMKTARAFAANRFVRLAPIRVANRRAI